MVSSTSSNSTSSSIPASSEKPESDLLQVGLRALMTASLGLPKEMQANHVNSWKETGLLKHMTPLLLAEASLDPSVSKIQLEAAKNAVKLIQVLQEIDAKELSEEAPLVTNSRTAKNKARKAKQKARAQAKYPNQISQQDKDKLLKKHQPMLEAIFKMGNMHFKNDLGFMSIEHVLSLGIVSIVGFIQNHGVKPGPHKMERIIKSKEEFSSFLLLLQSLPNPYIYNQLNKLFECLQITSEDMTFIKNGVHALVDLRLKLAESIFFERPVYQYADIPFEKKQKVIVYIHSLMQELAKFLPDHAKTFVHTLETTTESILKFWRMQQKQVQSSVPRKMSAEEVSYNKGIPLKECNRAVFEATSEIRNNLRILTMNLETSSKELSCVGNSKMMHDSTQQVRLLERDFDYARRWTDIIATYGQKVQSSMDQVLDLFTMSKPFSNALRDIKKHIFGSFYHFLSGLICEDAILSQQIKAFDVDNYALNKKFVLVLKIYIGARFKEGSISFTGELAKNYNELKSLFAPQLHPQLDSLLEDCFQAVLEMDEVYQNMLSLQKRNQIKASPAFSTAKDNEKFDLFLRIILMLNQFEGDVTTQTTSRMTLLVDDEEYSYNHPLAGCCNWFKKLYTDFMDPTLAETHYRAHLKEFRSHCEKSYPSIFSSQVASQLIAQQEGIQSDIDKGQDCIERLYALANCLIKPLQVLDDHQGRTCLSTWRAQLLHENFDDLDQWLSDPIYDPEPVQQPVDDAKKSEKAAKKPLVEESDEKEKESTSITLSLAPVSSSGSGLSTSHPLQRFVPPSTLLLSSLESYLETYYRTVANPSTSMQTEPLYRLARHDQLFNLHHLICTLEMIQSGICSTELREVLMDGARLQAHLVVERGATFKIRTQTPDRYLTHSLKELFEILELPQDGIIATKLDKETIDFRYGTNNRIPLDDKLVTITALSNNFIDVNLGICTSTRHFDASEFHAATQNNLLAKFQQEFPQHVSSLTPSQLLALIKVPTKLTKTANDLKARLEREGDANRREQLQLVLDQVTRLSLIPSAIVWFSHPRYLSTIAQLGFLTLQYVIKNTAMILAYDSGMHNVVTGMGHRDFNQIRAFCRRFQLDRPLTTAAEKTGLLQTDVQKGFEYISGYYRTHKTPSRHIELLSQLHRWSKATVDCRSIWEFNSGSNKSITELTQNLIDEIVSGTNIADKLVQAHLLSNE